MFKKALAFTAALAAVALLSSCAATFPVNATSNAVGSKVGEASGTQFMIWYVDGGDMSISKAAKNGGIRQISTVDFKVNQALALLGIIKYTTIVTGE